MKPAVRRAAYLGVFAAALLLLQLARPAAALAQAGGGYELTWWTVDGGGGSSAGGGYAVSGTLAQPEAGPEATGGAYALAGGVWTQLAGPPHVAISQQPSDATLTWPDVSGLQTYELWRDTVPYFTPGAPATLVASGYPPAGCTLASGTISCSLPAGVGDPNVNYFYVVRGIRPDLSPADSNTTGEFDFGLAPGG